MGNSSHISRWLVHIHTTIFLPECTGPTPLTRAPREGQGSHIILYTSHIFSHIIMCMYIMYVSCMRQLSQVNISVGFASCSLPYCSPWLPPANFSEGPPSVYLTFEDVSNLTLHGTAAHVPAYVSYSSLPLINHENCNTFTNKILASIHTEHQWPFLVILSIFNAFFDHFGTILPGFDLND